MNEMTNSDARTIKGFIVVYILQNIVKNNRKKDQILFKTILLANTREDFKAKVND